MGSAQQSRHYESGAACARAARKQTHCMAPCNRLSSGKSQKSIVGRWSKMNDLAGISSNSTTHNKSQTHEESHASDPPIQVGYWQANQADKPSTIIS